MTQVNLHALTLSGISHRCAQESDRFFNRQEHDPRFCYELFRRAILHRNEQAWDIVFTQYQRLVSYWVERNAAFHPSGEDAVYFVNRAFEKMWLGITPEKFDAFTDLKSILRYLQMCVHSVLVDFVRQKEYKLVQESMEDLIIQPSTGETAVEDHIADRIDNEALWVWLKQQFNNEKEEQVVYGMFVLGLKPSGVLSQYPGLFKDVKEVYRVKENLVARLQRNEEFKQFWNDA